MVSRILVAALLVLAASLAPILGYQVLAAASSTAGSLVEVLRDGAGSGLGTADGVVPDGTTVFDTDVPAVGNLDPALLAALQRAAGDARADGVGFVVDSGWRSRAYQQQLFSHAVAEYGSPEAAARWVAPPGTSAHEHGKAVDIGPADADAWLARHGAAYGLCRIYANEPWHVELRTAVAAGHGCPPMLANASDDPAVQVGR
jgi:hypothetical protein